MSSTLPAEPHALAVSLTPHAGAPIATPVECRNCGGTVGEQFCGRCGQRHHEHLDPTLKEIVHEAGEELLHLDGKLGVTLRLLLTAPGRLTREYVEGRRARYLSPLRLYLTCSVLFFFVMALTPTTGDLDIGTVKEQTASGTITRALTHAERDSIARSMERKANKLGGVRGAAMRGVARGEAQPEMARHAMVAAMPKMLFVLVPFFALATALVYRRRRLHYPTHLIFALHVFAFYFTISGLARLVRLAGQPSLTATASFVSSIAILAYLGLALHRTYGGRWWTTALRMATLLCIFGVGFVTVIIASAVIVLGRA